VILARETNIRMEEEGDASIKGVNKTY